MLCKQCNDLINGKWVECWRTHVYGHPVPKKQYLNGYYHHKTLQDLRDCAAKQNCDICRLVARESKAVDDDRAALPLLFNFRTSASVPLYCANITFDIIEQGLSFKPIAGIRIFPQDRRFIVFCMLAIFTSGVADM
jgi:hypothetical protein